MGWLALLVAMCSVASGRVRLAATLFQHGEATPMWPPPTGFGYTWQQGLGELTSEGLKTALLFGRQLKAQYAAPKAKTTVVAADADRTLQSAEAVARGLFGDANDGLEQLPVHGAVSDMLDGWQRCPTLGDLNSAVKQSPEWGNISHSPAFLSVRAYLASQLHLDASLESLEPITAYLILARPENVSSAMAATAISIGETARAVPFFEENSGAMYASLTAGIVVNDILARMKTIAASNETELVIYVGHAENLLGLLRILLGDNSPQYRTSPAAGSSLTVELDDAGLVTVIYRGDKLIVGEPCVDASCSLDLVRKRLQLYDDETFASSYWASICDRDLSTGCPSGPPDAAKFISFIPLWVVGSILGGLVGMVLAVLVVWRWWRNQQRRTRKQAVLEVQIN